MQPSPDLHDLLLRYWEAFSTADAAFVEAHLSSDGGILGIGTDPGEWYEGERLRRVFAEQLQAAGGVTVTAGDIHAFEEGSVGAPTSSPSNRPCRPDVPLPVGCGNRERAAPLQMTRELEMDLHHVANLLHEAAETHHRVYRITDGEDPDWASWYANWLIELSELPQLLGRKPVRSELVYLLVLLDKEVAQRQPAEPWEEYYARRVIEHLA